MIEWLRHRILSASITTAITLMMVKTVLPGVFDFLIDMAFVGLVGVIARLAQRAEDKK